MRKRRRRRVACSCSCLRTHSSVEFCVTPASLRSLVGVCEESEWSEVTVCADALRVASEENSESEPAASRTCGDRVRVLLTRDPQRVRAHVHLAPLAFLTHSHKAPESRQESHTTQLINASSNMNMRLPFCVASSLLIVSVRSAPFFWACFSSLHQSGADTPPSLVTVPGYFLHPAKNLGVIVVEAPKTMRNADDIVQDT